MPYRSQYRKFKKYKKKRYLGNRYVRLRNRKYFVSRLPITGTHYFKRTFSIPLANISKTSGGATGADLAYDATNQCWIISTGTTGNVSYHSMGMYFSMDNLPGVADFTSLFDSYKICGVKVKIIPFSTSSNLQQGTTGERNQNLSAMCYTVVDYDDYAQFPADSSGIDLINQYSTKQVRNPFAYDGKPISRYFVPHIAQATYSGALSTGYTTSRPKWLDCNNTKVEHYGYKVLWEVFAPDPAVTCYIWFKIEATMYMKFKGVR